MRIWVGFALVTSVLPVLFVTDDEETVSEIIGGWLAIYFIASAIIAAILGAGSIAQDTDVAADTILTRAVTRWDYVSSKLLSRLGCVVLVHIAATLPLLLLARRFGLDDATTGGLIMATLVDRRHAAVRDGARRRVRHRAAQHDRGRRASSWSCSPRRASSSTSSTSSTFSSTAVLDLLPTMIRGELGDWQQARILLAFGGGTVALAALAGIVFNEREF